MGDSSIFVTGQRGKVKLESVPHSPVGYGVEAGLLDAGEAMYHAEPHVVSNVLGSDDMRIEVGSTLDLAPRDTLIIASDGLTDNLHLHEAVETVRSGSTDPLMALVQILARQAARVHLASQSQFQTPSSPPKARAADIHGRCHTETNED